MGLYILQFSLFLAVFYIVYLVFLKKETFFQYNRWYVLITPCLALILPFIVLDFLRPETAVGQAFVNLPPVLLGDFSEGAIEGQMTQQVSTSFSFGQWISHHVWLFLYGIGFLVALFFLLKKIIQFKRFKNTGKLKDDQGVSYYEVQDSRMACTFFNQIFIGDEISSEQRTYILKHELVHVSQYHSLDLLFFEVLKILFWFHPAIYAYQKQLSSLHEFIADEEVTRYASKTNYYQSLLNVAFGTHQISFINQFFNHSLIKKRILMLQKSKSSTRAKLKYLIVLPLIALMLTYVSCSENELVEENAITDKENEDYKKDVKDELLTVFELKTIEVGDVDNLTAAEDKKFKQIFNQAMDTGKNIEIVLKDPNNKKFVKVNSSGNDIPVPPAPPVPTKLGEIGIPFTAIELVPAYPGCDQSLTNNEIKQCTSDKIKNFVNANFNVKLGEELGLTGVNRVYVRFTIAKDGSVKDVQSRAAYPRLSEEADRVVNSLPKMQPGMHDGKAVNVLYSLPIIFQIK